MLKCAYLFLSLFSFAEAARVHHLALTRHASQISSAGMLHVGVTVDVARVRSNVKKAQDLMWNLRYARQEEMTGWKGYRLHPTGASYSEESTAAYLDARDRELDLISRRVGTAETLAEDIVRQGRQRRNPALFAAAAVAGTAFGLYSLFQQQRLANGLDEHTDFALGLAKIEDVDLQRFGEQETVVGKLHSLADMTYEELKRYSYYTETDSAVEHIFATLDRQATYLEQAMDAMHSGRLSAGTLPNGALQEAVRKASVELASKGYRTLYNTVHQLLQCQVSAVTDGKTMRLLLHVPLVHAEEKESTMWRHIRELPIKLSEGVMLELEATHPYIVVDPEERWYQVFSEEEVEDCRRSGNTLVCDRPVARRVPPTNDTTPQGKHCMWHLWKGDLAGVNRTCKVHVRRPVDNAVHLHDRAWMVELEEEHDAAIRTCNGYRERTPITLPTLSFQEVDEGCELEVRGKFLLNGRQEFASVVEEDLRIHELHFDPRELVHGVDHQAFERLLQESKAIEAFPTHLPEIKKFLQTEEHFRTWAEERPTGNLFQWMGVGSVGTGGVALTLVLGVMLWLCCCGQGSRTDSGQQPATTTVYHIGDAENGRSNYRPSPPMLFDPQVIEQARMRMPAMLSLEHRH
jgi:hypothetical protein